MTEQTAPTRRPAELTLIVVLIYVSALASIVLGVLLILARYLLDDSEQTARTVVTIAGAIVVLIGFMLVSLASGITRGDRNARILATVLLGLGVTISLLALVIDPDHLWPQLVGAVVNGGVIAVLWTGRVRRFFARSSA
jgi:O-antigen/teichoic acid export membrane protein